MAELKTKIRIRRDQASKLNTVKLEAGEPAYAIDTKKLAIGDGENTFEKLKDYGKDSNTWRPIYTNNDLRLSSTGGTDFHLNNGTNTTIRYATGGNFYIDAKDTVYDDNKCFYKDGSRKATGDFDLDNHSIKNLPKNGGIYWEPHMESSGDPSDAASITVESSSGATKLILKVANDSDDNVEFRTGSKQIIVGTSSNSSKNTFTFPNKNGTIALISDMPSGDTWNWGQTHWTPKANIALNATDNNDEWSFDFHLNGKTGCYWHVWEENKSSLLKVNADDGMVSAPYGMTSKKFVKSGGSSSQVLMADGSVKSWPTIPPDPTGKYLPLAGGTMTGNINFYFTETSKWVGAAPGIKWSGGSDGAQLTYRCLESDKGEVNLNFIDDSNPKMSFSWKDKIGSEIRNDGYHICFNTEGSKDDSMGIFPSANNWNQIGSDSLRWYRGYINNIYNSSLFSNYVQLGTNTQSISFRSGYDDYDTGLYYGTSGNEALTIATSNTRTSIQFINGRDPKNYDETKNPNGMKTDSWKSIKPGLQIKGNKVAINKILGDDQYPKAELDVQGSIYGSKYAGPNGAHITTIVQDLNSSSLGLDVHQTNQTILKELLKKICQLYPNSSGIFKGKMEPNSIGYYHVYIYNTSALNSENLPQHSFGMYYKYGMIVENFGTSNYNYYFREMASLNDIPELYTISDAEIQALF